MLNGNDRNELELLLSESIDDAIARENETFDNFVPSGTPIVLFGAGNIGKRTLKGLRQVGISPVAFADNNEKIWGCQIDGIPVLSPLEAATRFPSSAFVVTIWTGEGWDTMEQRCKSLREMGCSTVVPFGFLFWKHSGIFLPHYALDLPHKVLESADIIRSVYDLWSDDASRSEYVAQVRWRLHHSFNLPAPSKIEIYFPNDLFSISSNEVFIDCGAFDGDTLKRFLEVSNCNFKKAVCFEPDPDNFVKLESFVSTLPKIISERIVLMRKAVGEIDETVKFSAMGNEASFVGNGLLEVHSVPLDEACRCLEPTYIKMDTEGSEPYALLGSKAILREFAPALAICCYHRQDHLWTIPSIIAKANSSYNFHLRPQLLDVWDLVCYAVPQARTL